MVEQTAPFSFGVYLNSTSHHPVITAEIVLIHDLAVFNVLMFICHDVVNFVKSFVVWTTLGPSSLVLLFEERVHDLKAVGNGEVDKILTSVISITIRRLDILHLRLQLL